MVDSTLERTLQTLLKMDVEETAQDSDPNDQVVQKIRPPRQSKRRKRSQARKVAEHGDALTIPKPSLDLCIHRSSTLCLEQLEKLIEQLGYFPYNLVEVGSSAPAEDGRGSGDPQVAVLYPMNKSISSGRYAKDWLPFPTMLWLSCPKLHTDICELEVEGWVEKMQDRLEKSDESATYIAAMENAHRLYATERWSLLSEEDLRRVEENGW